MFWNIHRNPGATLPLFSFLLLLLLGPKLFAQPSNDSCAVARLISLPTTFGEPLQITGHNIGATPEIPATVNANCTPGGIFSGLGADVWYRFTAPQYMCVRIELSGLEQPEFSLRRGLNCFFNEEVACVFSEEGTASEVVELQPGEDYWLRVSGVWYSDQGYFDLSLTRVGCPIDDPCMINDSYSVSPEPSLALINGELVEYYLPGTTVNFCYSVNIWETIGVNWLHAVEIDLGNGWDVNSVVPIAPESCNPGYWDWFPLWVSCNTGELYGPGFAYESNNGVQCGGGPFDGDPGNNWGDGPNQCLPTEFCWTVTVKTCEQQEDEPGTNLDINITALADSESGSYDVIACGNEVDEFIELTTFACGDEPPPACFPQEPFLEVFPVSCVGEMDGSFTIDNVDTDSLSNIFIYSLNDQLIEAFLDVSLPFTIPGILDTGFYGVILETPGIAADGFCEGILYTIIKVGKPFEAFARITAEQDCAVDSINLVARVWPDTVSGLSYMWTGPNDFFSTEPDPIITESGEYTLTVIRGDCRVSDVISVTFRDALELVVDYTSSQPCFGEPLNLTASGADSPQDYEWLIPPEAGLSNPIYVTDDGYWSLGVLNDTVSLQLVGFTSTGCADTISFTAEPAPFPNLQYSATLDDCNEEAVVVLIEEGESIASVEWPDDGSNANPRSFADIAPGEIFSTFVTVVNDFGCETSETIQLVGPGVEITMSDTITCPGAPVVLTATLAESYAWSTGDTTSMITVFPDDAEHTYSVTITNTYDCVQQDAVSITVLPAPEASFSYTANNSAYQFLPNAVDNPDFNYWWDFGDGTLSVNYAPQHTYLMPGDYTVSLTTTGTCGSVTTTQTITIPFAPTVSFSSSTSSGCAPLEVAFTNESTDAESYSWSFPGGTPETSELENPLVTYTEPGIYPVSLTATGPGGSNSTTVDGYVEVFSGPGGTLEFSIDELDVQFSTTTENVTEVIWNLGDGTIVESNTAPLHTYSAPGTYDIHLSLINACDTLVLEDHITISLAVPIANFSTATGRIGCAPLSVEFDNLSTNSDTYQWTFPGGVPATSNDEAPTVVYLNEGIYPVTLIASNASGSDTTITEDYITVFPQAEGTFTFETNLLEVTFIADITNADSFSWDFGDGNASTEENPVHNYEIGGSYEVSLTVENDCGSNTFITTVIVTRPIPNVAFTTLNERRGCAPLIISFINESENALSYQWTFPGGNPASSTEENPTVVYETPGIYLVQLNAVNESGGNALVAESYVEVISPPNGSFSFTTEELSVDFTSMAENTNNYEWDFGDGNSASGEFTSHQYANNGTYEVTLALSNECDTVLITEQVSVMRALPTAAFTTGADTSGCAPLTVSFINQSIGADSYLWTFSGGDPASSTEQNPTVIYETPGIFPVELLAVNESGTDQFLMNDLVEVLPLPFAEISFVADSLEVDFMATGEAVDSYFWQFGDGNSSTEQNPSHTYANGGTYTVELSVSNDCGTVSFSEILELIVTSTDNQLNQAANWTVQPNPNNGQMVIAVEDWQIFGQHTLLVYSSSGQLLGSRSLDVYQPTANHALWLELPAGLYWLELKDQHGVRRGIEKVIIQR